jgi:hypothetical protein
MDEFDKWQAEQEAEGVFDAGQQQQQTTQMTHAGNDYGADDIMDPSDIPLCMEYAATGLCSAGDECAYIHGDECEVRGGKRCVAAVGWFSCSLWLVGDGAHT